MQEASSTQIQYKMPRIRQNVVFSTALVLLPSPGNGEDTLATGFDIYICRQLGVQESAYHSSRISLPLFLPGLDLNAPAFERDDKGGAGE